MVFFSLFSSLYSKTLYPGDLMHWRQSFEEREAFIDISKSSFLTAPGLPRRLSFFAAPGLALLSVFLILVWDHDILAKIIEEEVSSHGIHVLRRAEERHEEAEARAREL